MRDKRNKKMDDIKIEVSASLLLEVERNLGWWRGSDEWPKITKQLLEIRKKHDPSYWKERRYILSGKFNPECHNAIRKSDEGKELIRRYYGVNTITLIPEISICDMIVKDSDFAEFYYKELHKLVDPVIEREKAEAGFS